MMNHKKVAALCAVFIGVGAAISAGITDTRSTVKCYHAIAGMGNINIRVDRGAVANSNIRFGSASGARSFPASDYLVDVTTERGRTTIIPPEANNFFADQRYVLVATGSVSGSPALDTLQISIPDENVPRNEARVIVINACPDGPSYNTQIDGGTISAGLAFNNYSATTVVSPGRHSVSVNDGIGTILGPQNVVLQGGKTHFLVIQGTAEPGDGLPQSIGRFVY